MFDGVPGLPLAGCCGVLGVSGLLGVWGALPAGCCGRGAVVLVPGCDAVGLLPAAGGGAASGVRPGFPLPGMPAALGVAVGVVGGVVLLGGAGCLGSWFGVVEVGFWFG
ncbi:hypothetical protein AR457_01355 [Streptomyces agglomeratus]|uniref:Uncharacterized protein n=1 Tax=Streptomyces agglomeratus TaxID=285458 RepID=A0A1E5P1E4_9ACTN|nr:hypothetical protein AS594_01545 [Streptomyces agglomeratus]OEJ42951.1 hypothetical protein AR457_01355 [Streptomyces agglomeratus]